MDGRNSFGRRISLLNDDVPTTVTRKSYSSTSTAIASRYSPSLSTSSTSSSSQSLRHHSFTHSRASSSGRSTPCLSPQTPPLVRSNSTDSMDMDVPSPITPEFAGDGYEPLPGIASQTAAQLYPQTTAAYFVHSQKDAAGYQPVPSHSIPLPYPRHAQQQQHQSASIAYAPVHRSSASYDQSSAKPQAARSAAQQHQRQQSESDARQVPHAATRTKKGQHPCPLAKQYNCPDTFTTSGHASRHAKKHTGEKLAICPDCGKDFTRKDNMEQHRKTHLNGRNANKGRNPEASKSSRPQTKRPKPSPIQSAVSAIHSLDSMSVSSASASALPLQHQLPDFVVPSQEPISMHTYPDPANCALNAVPLAYPGAPLGTGSSSALHALASAASVEGKRYIGGY